MLATFTALRILHLVGATFWVGVGLFSVLFLTPVVQRSGPEGQSVMRQLVGNTRFPLAMNLASLLTIASGMVMFWFTSGSLNSVWLASSTGMVLTGGAILGIAGFLVSSLVQTRMARKLAAVTHFLESSGQAPTSEQLNQIRIYQDKLIRGARVTLALTLISLICMAMFRHIG